MNLEEKNNLYHNILSIIKDKSLADQDKATDITLYVEQLLSKQLQDFEESKELYGGEGAPNLPPPKFGKTFKRVV